MCYSDKCLLFSRYYFNNGFEVANAAHNTLTLLVHFKGQSSMIQHNKKLGHFPSCQEMKTVFTQFVQ